MQAAQALSDSSAKRAECRHLLIQQAKQRAEERERERLKVKAPGRIACSTAGSLTESNVASQLPACMYISRLCTNA